jgi:hypothetical protein
MWKHERLRWERHLVYDNASQIEERWAEKVTANGFEKGKVKVTLVQALRLCTGRTADRGRRGIALPFHDHGTRRR